MTLPAPTYDLVLLLDAATDEEVRSKLLADTEAMIGARGEVIRHDKWGERQLAYPIDDKTSAEYHLLQFHVSTRELLAELDRTLRIADGVVRFRIVKLKSGTPDAPDMIPAPAVAAPVAVKPPESAPEPEAVAEPAPEAGLAAEPVVVPEPA